MGVEPFFVETFDRDEENSSLEGYGEFMTRNEFWRIGEVLDLIGEPDERLEGTCVRRTGASQWKANIEVGGKTYLLWVARYARRAYPWSWEISRDGMRLAGSDEQTLEGMRQWAWEELADLG